MLCSSLSIHILFILFTFYIFRTLAHFLVRGALNHFVYAFTLQLFTPYVPIISSVLLSLWEWAGTKGVNLTKHMIHHGIVLRSYASFHSLLRSN